MDAVIERGEHSWYLAYSNHGYWVETNDSGQWIVVWLSGGEIQEGDWYDSREAAMSGAEAMMAVKQLVMTYLTKV